LWLVEEAVESFLRQDYPSKELVVCNDTPNQRLQCDAENVRVLNIPQRFPTLSAKLSFMIQVSRGALLARWDDDDICMPWRLSYSRERLGDLMEWRAVNHFYCPNNRVESISRNPAGNAHERALWRRDVLDLIGGYPMDASGWEDALFLQALTEHDVDCRAEEIPNDRIYYFYRWGVSDHLSGKTSDRVGMQEHYDELGCRPCEHGTFDIRPRWKTDYLAMHAEAVGRLT